jgi:hypothetical protein
VIGDVAGEPLDRDTVIDRFAAFPEHLSAAVRAADGRPVAAGEWTPALVVRHLIAVEGEVWRARLASLVVGGEPHWSWVEPGPVSAFPDATLDDIVEVFAQLRAGTVGYLRVFDLDERGWDRVGIHDTYGPLDVVGLLRLAIGHDEEHLTGLGASA